jgi:hypothetical protein
MIPDGRRRRGGALTQRGEIGFFGEVCTWRGASGRRYRFSVYPLDTPALALDGVYVLAAEGDLFTPYRPLLIGACADFARDLPGSTALQRAATAGASSLHLYYCNLTNPDRRALERDLIERYWPPLNREPGWLRPATAPDRPAVVIPFPMLRKQPV